MWNLIKMNQKQPSLQLNKLTYYWLILSVLCIHFTSSIDVTTSTKFTATPTVATTQENTDQTAAATTSITDNFLSKLISSAVTTDKITPSTLNKRNVRDNRYYARDYASDQYSTSSTNAQQAPIRNLKATDQPNPTTLGNSPQHTVERRCLRCVDPYYDERRGGGYPTTGYDRRYDDRRSNYDRYDYRRPEYYDPYSDERSMARPVGRYDDRYYTRNYDRGMTRPYDVDRRPYDYDRYDAPRTSGGGYRGTADPYERDPYYYDMRYESRRPTGGSYDYNRYDRYDGYRGGSGYESPPRGDAGFRPWDETTRGQSGWDNTGRGYYFASGGRPEPSGYWGGGYDRGYAQGWNYGSGATTGSDAGYRDDWRDPGAYRPRDPYYNRGSSGSGGYRGTSYLYDRDGRPPQTTTPRSSSHPDDSSMKDHSSNNDTKDMNNNNNPNSGYKQ